MGVNYPVIILMIMIIADLLSGTIKMEGEDVQYRHKFKKNWSDMKEVLSTQWRKLLDKCLENGIVDFEDIERIQSELHDSDTVQLLLLKVIRLKKFEVFLTIMDTMCIEFKQLADRVRETGKFVLDIHYAMTPAKNTYSNSLFYITACQT